MALQLIQQPGEVSFSGDPIVVKVKTTLTGKTFLRIQMKCAVTLYRDGESRSYEESYSYEVSTDGVALFNVGEAIKTAFDAFSSQEVTSSGIEQLLFAAKYKLIFHEVYLDGRIEVTEGQLESSEYKAVMGELTEYERMIASSADTAAILGDGRVMSRKPEGERLVKGRGITIPMINTKTDTVSVTAKQDEITREVSIHTGGAFVPKTLTLDDSWMRPEAVKLITSVGETLLKYIIDPHPGLVSFLFINGFGMIESATAETKETLAFEGGSETYTVSKEIGFRPNTSICSYAQHFKGRLKMSSGYTTLEWAEWWITEFVTTRKAWMWYEDKWIPVAIIPEESNKLYDLSKPGLVAVNFEVRYSFTGGTRNLFVKS